MTKKIAEQYQDEEFFNSQGMWGGQRCGECEKWIKLPRKRKSEMAVFYTECDDCSIKDDLRRAFHRMNKVISSKERSAFNKFRHDIWCFGDSVRELCRSLDNTNDFRYPNAEKLMKEISKIPILDN